MVRFGACRYDFALPLLVLHAFEFSTASNLKNWLSICPRRQITVLDTHDGMGVDDITGLAEVDPRTKSSPLAMPLTRARQRFCLETVQAGDQRAFAPPRKRTNVGLVAGGLGHAGEACEPTGWRGVGRGC